MMMTSEREKEIRKWAEQDCGSGHPVTILLAEIDRLRANIHLAKDTFLAMKDHICDGGGDFPCSQMWFQEFADEALSKIRDEK